MLDADLASLYSVTTGNLNKAVSGNLDRFPEDFMFQLTWEEFDCLRFQIGISSSWGGRRYRPRAFSEQGDRHLSRRQPRAAARVLGRVRLSAQSAEAAHGRVPNIARLGHGAHANTLPPYSRRARYAQAA